MAGGVCVCVCAGLTVPALAVSSGAKVMHKEGLVAFVGSHYSLTVWQL